MKTTLNIKKPTVRKVLPWLKILLAENEPADCLLFKEALEELPVSSRLSVVTQKNNHLPTKNKFMITGDSVIILDKK